MSYANARYRFGQLQQNDPSRFLEEISESYLDKSYAGGAIKNSRSTNNWLGNERGFGSGNQWATSGKSVVENKKASYVMPTSRPQVKAHIPSENFEPSDTSNLRVGNQVEHMKFGFGEVLKIEGSAHNPIATVNFDLNGEKKIMLNYAKLRIVTSSDD